MLDLYYDIDPKGFSKNITLPLCENYLKYYDSCIVPSNVNKELINRRIALQFLIKYAFVLLLKRGKGDLNENHLFGQKNELNFRERKFRIRGDYNGINLYFNYSFDYRNRDLLYLLFVKNSKITSLSCFPRKEEWLPIIADSFEKEVIFDVDMRIGDNNDKTYAAINNMITPREWITLDYQACKNEVEKIHNEIDQIKKFSKLPKRSANS